jgi:leucyl-tRNA synthetase
MSTGCKDYNPHEIEPRWQSFWEENRTFATGAASAKPKYYVLDMFPYPSGAGLHLGHPLGYTATDIIARRRRAQGFNVLHPMGWDAFGLPAEQHAVKTGTHPAGNTRSNISNFRRQIRALGYSYDWDREIDTTDPRYYRWTQWIFLRLFQRGLAYVDERPVWWCPELRTVLANEEVIDGRSEVGGFPVERRRLRQWVLRITAYAERLLEDLGGVDWPDSTKRMQEAWIGRSEGADVLFGLDAPASGTLPVFTTRPDTLFGCTYMVLAPEHPLVGGITAPSERAAVEAYQRKSAAKSDLERTDLAKEKTGVFTGSHAINPVNGLRVPVWIADYVLMGYGTGAIMAVPAHDTRDHEFALKFGLPITRVIEGGAAGDGGLVLEGTMVNSGFLDGLASGEARGRMTAWLEANGRGSGRVNYKLRDWLFSRQRYWGEPIPVVWVSEEDYRRAAAGRTDLPAEPVAFTHAGISSYALPVPAGALPLELPDVQTYLPSGTGESPLANATEWVEIWFNHETGEAVPADRPRPAGPAWMRGRRETNTMPQWAGSCWYYLRFVDPRNDTAFASEEALRFWRGPDLYVGGAEHAVLHLLYARFWHKVLFDLGLVPDKEPFRKLFHQGTLLGEDGEKMSKSRGNVVNPDAIIASHGADTLRLYLMFLGPLEAMKPWNPRGIEGVHRFLQKVWRECVAEDGSVSPRIAESAEEPDDFLRLLHETIRKVGDDIDELHFNTAISQMMIFVNAWQKVPKVSLSTVRAFLRLLAPFAPHIAEELWSRLGGSAPVQAAGWPPYDAARLVSREVKLVFQVNGRHRGDQLVPVGIGEGEALKLALAHPKVVPYMEGSVLKRVIYVPGKIINLVVVPGQPVGPDK